MIEIYCKANETPHKNTSPEISELVSVCRMVKEELCFGGDWKTAREKLDYVITKYTSPLPVPE